MSSVLRKLFRKKSLVGISFYQGNEFSQEDIKSHLSQYPGGSVDLKLDDTTGIATIYLNHQKKKNAFSGKMMTDLEDVVKQLEAWECGKGLIIFGAENNFCSGGDLHFAESTGTAEGGYKMATFMQNVLLRLQQLPLISVAFIQGFAVGGGAEVAISCDFRVFANDAAMGFVHTRMGVIPAWGGLSTAVRTLGYRGALDLVATGRVVRAAEAERIGLCDGVVEDLDGALDWLMQRTRGDASVIRAAKCVTIYSSLGNNRETEDVLDFEKRIFSPLWGGPANKIALSQKLKHK